MSGASPRLAPTSAAEVRRVLEIHGLSPLHRLGQNFLVRPAVLDAQVAAAGIREGDVVLEVGPGLGGLTERLLVAGATVVAVELDRGLSALLPELLERPPALDLVTGDVMASKSALRPEVLERLAHHGAGPGLGPWKIVSNLPYQVSSPFLASAAMQEAPPFTVATVMLQREVGVVLRARPGSSDYSPLSFLARLYLKVERVMDVPPDAFYPAPRVSSQVIRLRPADPRPVPARELLPFARALFLHRRKAIRTNLPDALRTAGLPGGDRELLLEAAGIRPGDRIDGVEPEAVERLFLAARGSAPRRGGPEHSPEG